jgi:hypothetical protein
MSNTLSFQAVIAVFIFGIKLNTQECHQLTNKDKGIANHESLNVKSTVIICCTFFKLLRGFQSTCVFSILSFKSHWLVMNLLRFSFCLIAILIQSQQINSTTTFFWQEDNLLSWEP